MSQYLQDPYSVSPEGPSPAKVASTSLFRKGSHLALPLEFGGGKKGAKVIVDHLNQIQSKQNVEETSHLSSIRRSSNSRKDPSAVEVPQNPRTKIHLEKMLEKKIEKLEDLNDYHIITHKQDAKQKKIAVIGGRRIGKRITKKQGANFDASLLNEFSELRKKRVDKRMAASHQNLLDLTDSPHSSTKASESRRVLSRPKSSLNISTSTSSSSLNPNPLSETYKAPSANSVMRNENEVEEGAETIEQGRNQENVQKKRGINITVEGVPEEEEDDDDDDDDDEEAAPFRLSENLMAEELYPDRKSVVAESPRGESEFGPIIDVRYTINSRTSEFSSNLEDSPKHQQLLNRKSSSNDIARRRSSGTLIVSNKSALNSSDRPASLRSLVAVRRNSTRDVAKLMSLSGTDLDQFPLSESPSHHPSPPPIPSSSSSSILNCGDNVDVNDDEESGEEKLPHALEQRTVYQDLVTSIDIEDLNTDHKEDEIKVGINEEKTKKLTDDRVGSNARRQSLKLNLSHEDLGDDDGDNATDGGGGDDSSNIILRASTHHRHPMHMGQAVNNNAAGRTLPVVASDIALLDSLKKRQKQDQTRNLNVIAESSSSSSSSNTNGVINFKSAYSAVANAAAAAANSAGRGKHNSVKRKSPLPAAAVSINLKRASVKKGQVPSSSSSSDTESRRMSFGRNHSGGGGHATDHHDDIRDSLKISVADRLSEFAEFIAENAETYEDKEDHEERRSTWDRSSAFSHNDDNEDGEHYDQEQEEYDDEGNIINHVTASSLYWWDLKPADGGTWDPSHRLWRAGIYCRDAINERPIKLYRAAKLPLTVYDFVQSTSWNHLYLAAALVHLILLFLEPASWRVVNDKTLAYESSGIFVFESKMHAFPHYQGCILVGIELLVLSIYISDSLLSLYAMGIPDIFGEGIERRLLRLTNKDNMKHYNEEIGNDERKKNKKNCQNSFLSWFFGWMSTSSSANTRFEKTRMILWGCMALDLISMITSTLVDPNPSSRPVRWSRPLRALMPMIASSELRRWTKMILLTIPEITVLACFFLLILIIYGIIGIHLFSSSDNNCYAAANEVTDDPNAQYPSFIRKSFQDIGHAMVAMYVLSTTENYPLVMYPAYDCGVMHDGEEDSNLDHFFSTYFLSFIIVVMFGINVLSVPMLYSGLIKHITADAAIGRRLERTALHASFELLDWDDRGYLNIDQFACLVNELRPDLFVDYDAAVAMVNKKAAIALRKRAEKRERKRARSMQEMDNLNRARGNCFISFRTRCSICCDIICRFILRQFKRLFKTLKHLVFDKTYSEFGTAFEYCYPEIRRLHRGEEVPDGYRLADFSQIDSKHGIRFAVADTNNDEDEEEDENDKNETIKNKMFGDRGGFVEKPQYAGAVELMFNQLANFDYESGLGDDDWENDEGRIGPLEFFKCAEVILRDFHSVEVLKQRDSLYTMLFGRCIGYICGSLRDRLLFDGWWKQGLRIIDLLLTFAHVLVLALHRNAGGSSFSVAGQVRVEKLNHTLYVGSLAITTIVLTLLILKFIVLRPARFFKSRANVMDVMVVPLAFCCEVAFFREPSPYRDIGGMIMSVRLIRLVLSIDIFKKLYVLLVGKEYLIFTLQSVFLFIVLWATLGMMVFAGYENHDESYTSASGSGLTDPNIGFDTFAVALFTMFQIFTTSNWHEVMYRGMTTAVPSWASPLFFISFHYFITTVVMQLMIAILVEMFIQISSDPNLSTLLSGTNAFERSSQYSSASSLRPNSTSRASVASSRNESVPTETVALGKRHNFHLSTVEQEEGSEIVYDDMNETDPYLLNNNYDDDVIVGVELQEYDQYGPMMEAEEGVPTLLKGQGQQSVILEEDEETEDNEDDEDGRGDQMPEIGEHVKQVMSEKVQAIRGRAWSAAPAPTNTPPLNIDTTIVNRARRSSTASSNRSSTHDSESTMTRLRSGSSGVDDRGRSRTNSGSHARESADAQMLLRNNTPRGIGGGGGGGNTSFHERDVRGFGHQKGHSNATAFGLQASSHRVRANESNFKQTASALHVLARRTDRSAFDKVDKELGEALQSGVGALSGNGENSEAMNRVHNQRAGLGAGRRSVISMVTDNTDTFDTGRRHISMKTVGMMAMASSKHDHSSKDGGNHPPSSSGHNQGTPTMNQHKTIPHHQGIVATQPSLSGTLLPPTPQNGDQPGGSTTSVESDRGATGN